MSHHVRPPRIRRTAACVAALAVAFTPVVLVSGTVGAVAAPEQRRASPTADFTAGVKSINHGLGIVRLVGTGPIGGSIGITGDGVETTWTESTASGTWSADVRVRSGDRVLRVTSQVSGKAIDVHASVLILRPPEMLAIVDGIERTIQLEGTGYPGAHFVIKEGSETLAEADVDDEGLWSATLTGLAFGEHHVEAWQYFDGEHNGGVDEVYTLAGAAVVTAASASRETERIHLAGRAPADTTLRFSDAQGPVLGANGEPVVVTVPASTRWDVQLPIPEAVRFHTITVTTSDGDTTLGTTDARVTVPLAITGSAEELPDGSVKLSGTGEVGGVVGLETESGQPVVGEDGEPITTTIGRSWELVVARDDLPADVVVARQRVDGVEQGALRLVLPKLPVRPGPDEGAASGSGPGISIGTHPSAAHASAGRITATPSTKLLAFTGDDPSAPLALAGSLLSAGVALLAAARFARSARRRPSHRV